MALVIDTGPLYAAIDRSDPEHASVVEALRSTPRPHVLPSPVLVEIDYWIRKFLDLSAFDALVQDIVAGRYELEPVAERDLERIAELESQYREADIGFVDAAIAATSERLDIGTLLTFDRRHFAMIRPQHVTSFNLKP
jgi:predicted nucleic acid-binding protein